MQRKTNTGKYDCGLLLSLLASFFGYVLKLIHNSFIVSLLTDYRKLEGAGMQSKSSGVVSYFSKLNHKTLKFKNRCAKYAEQSIFMNVIDNACEGFFRTNLRSVGIFLLSAGCLIVSACFANHSDSIIKLDFSDTFILGSVMLLASLFLLPQKNKSISGCIRDSRFLSYFLVEIFYVKHLDISGRKEPYSTSAFAFIMGIAFGSVSYAVSPVLALFILGFTAYLYLIFTKPENGILLICLHIPLLSAALLKFLIASTALSLVFKIIRGKRAFSLNICSGAVIVWGLVFVSGSLFSFDKSGAFSECMPFLIGMLLTLTVIMSVRSSALSDKCFRMLGLSVLISLFLALNGVIMEAASGNDVLQSFLGIFSGGFSGTFNSPESCSAFLVAMIPLFVVKHPTNSKIFSFPSLALAVLCLILCSSFNAILSLCIALVISMTIFTKFGIITAIIAAVAGFAVPRAVIALFDISIPVFDAAAEAAYKSVSQLVRFFSEYGYTGAGMGNESVAYASLKHGINASHIENGYGVYTDFAMKLGIPLMLICVLLVLVFVSKTITYALSKYKSESAKSKCAALFTSVLGLGIYAFFSDFLYDFRILALLFLILGLSSAITDSAEADYISPDRYPEHEIL